MLNPDAPAFVPAHQLHVEQMHYAEQYITDDYDEQILSEDELLELEACEAWVELMADLDQMETDHMIAFALEHAPAAAAHIEEEVAGSKHRPRSATKAPTRQ